MLSTQYVHHAPPPAIAEAKVAAGAGDNAKGLEILDALLDRDASNTDAWVLRAHLTSDLADKLHSLGRALDIDPENAVARATYEFLAAPAVDLPEVFEDEPEAEFGPVAEMVSEPVAASPFDSVVETAYDHPVEKPMVEIDEPVFEAVKPAVEEPTVEEAIFAEAPTDELETVAEEEKTEEFQFQQPEPVVEYLDPQVETVDEDAVLSAEEIFSEPQEMADPSSDALEDLSPMAEAVDEPVEEPTSFDPYKRSLRSSL